MSGTVVGPWLVAEDATPAQLALVRQAVNGQDPRIIAMFVPGEIDLTFTRRPVKTPSWAWGFSPVEAPDPNPWSWINPVNPDGDNGIVYSIDHELGHQWFAKFGQTKALAVAIAPFAAGSTFSTGYDDRRAEWKADTFARATSGGKFKGILQRFWRFILLTPDKAAAFTDALVKNAKVVLVPEVPQDPPPVPVTPPPPDPAALQAQLDAITVERDEARSELAAAQRAEAELMSRIAGMKSHGQAIVDG